MPEKARSRSYSAAYKKRILEEYERLDKAGKGALLRREGLYHSHIQELRNARDTGALQNLTDGRTSPQRPSKHPAQAEAERLRAKVEHLEKEVTQRDEALRRTYEATPERFARPPSPPTLPEVVWINDPARRGDPQPQNS